MRYIGNYYNEKRRANARANIAKYPWAKKEADGIVEKADSFLSRFYIDVSFDTP